MLFDAVKVKFRGTAALGAVGVLLVPAGAVRIVPVPAVLIVANGRANTTVLADVAELTT